MPALIKSRKVGFKSGFRLFVIFRAMNKFVKTAFFSFGRRLPAFLYSELKRLYEDEAFSKMKLFDDDDDEEKLIFAGADDFFSANVWS